MHGLAHKPGKPTIVALVGGKPVFGLPGNPVSAMVVFELLVRPTIYALSGLSDPPAPGAVSARLTRDLPSQAGREDHVHVKLARRGGGPLRRAELRQVQPHLHHGTSRWDRDRASG